MPDLSILILALAVAVWFGVATVMSIRRLERAVHDLYVRVGKLERTVRHVWRHLEDEAPEPPPDAVVRTLRLVEDEREPEGS